MSEEILSMRKMQEILEIIMETTAQTKEHLFALEERVENRFDLVDKRFDKVDERLDYHETWLNRIEKNMATKSQFNRLSERFNKLVGILDKDQIISSYDATRVTYSEPL